jgi:hypothetical protein
MPIGVPQAIDHRPANHEQRRRIRTSLAFPMSPITHARVDSGVHPESGPLTWPPRPAMLAPIRGDRAHAYCL